VVGRGDDDQGLGFDRGRGCRHGTAERGGDIEGQHGLKLAQAVVGVEGGGSCALLRQDGGYGLAG